MEKWLINMVFVGMDYGTTGVSFSILANKPAHFKIGREELSKGDVSALDELNNRINLDSIDSNGYYLCDG